MKVVVVAEIRNRGARRSQASDLLAGAVCDVRHSLPNPLKEEIASDDSVDEEAKRRLPSIIADTCSDGRNPRGRKFRKAQGGAMTIHPEIIAAWPS